jgi:hypothetical protein
MCAYWRSIWTVPKLGKGFFEPGITFQVTPEVYDDAQRDLTSAMLMRLPSGSFPRLCLPRRL